MALVLDSKQFAAYHAKLAEQFRPTILRGVRAGAARAVGYLVQRTRTAPPANPAGIGSGGAVNTGALARGWRKVDMPDGAALVNSVGYAGVVDGGRRAGSKFPPKAALIAWIKRKLLTRPKPKRRGSVGSKGDRRAAAEAKRLRQQIERFARQDPRHGPRAPEKYGPQRKPKPKLPKRDGAGKRIKKTPSADAMAARLYFPIARAIARRGLLARRIYSGAEATTEIMRLVIAEVGAELAREQGKR